MTIKIKTSLLCVLPLLLSLTACDLGPKFWADDSVKLTLEPEAATRLVSNTHNGSISSKGDPKLKTVLVTAKIRGGGATPEDAEAALAAIEPFCTEEDGAVSVGWAWKEEKSDGWGAQVSFEISYPAAWPIQFETHNGSVQILGAETKAEVLTHNGSISISANLSDIDLTTHNGGIQATLNAEGRLSGQMSTHNGTVEVNLPETVSTKLVAETHNGRATCSLPATETDADKTHWSGTLGAGEGSLTIGSHNGSITVK